MLRFFISILALLLIGVTPKPNLVGTWEGVMNGPNGPTRRIMEITKAGSGAYDVVIHSLDETDVPIVTKDVALHGNAVVMKFDMNTAPWTDYHREYDANLNDSGTKLTGKWHAGELPSLWSIQRSPMRRGRSLNHTCSTLRRNLA